MMARCFTHADRQQINFCYWSCYMWRWKPKLRAVNSNPLTLSPPSAHCHSLPSAFDECRLFAINQQSCCRPHPPSPCISITCCCECVRVGSRHRMKGESRRWKQLKSTTRWMVWPNRSISWFQLCFLCVKADFVDYLNDAQKHFIHFVSLPNPLILCVICFY